MRDRDEVALDDRLGQGSGRVRVTGSAGGSLSINEYMKLNQYVEFEKVINKEPEDFKMLGLKKVTESVMPQGKNTVTPMRKNQIMPLGFSDLPGRPDGKMDPPERAQESLKSSIMVSQLQNSRLPPIFTSNLLIPEATPQQLTGVIPSEIMTDFKIQPRAIHSRIVSQPKNNLSQELDASLQPVTPRRKQQLVTQLYENALKGQSQKDTLKSDQPLAKLTEFFGMRGMFKSNATCAKNFQIQDQDQFFSKSQNRTLTAEISAANFADDFRQICHTKIMKILQNQDGDLEGCLVAYCGELELETLQTGEKIPILVVENFSEGNEKIEENVFRNKSGEDHSLQILPNGDLIFNNNHKLVFQRIAKGDGIYVINLSEKLSVED
jgi:hypothetical protein